MLLRMAHAAHLPREERPAPQAPHNQGLQS
jgi:hypothetical protein